MPADSSATPALPLRQRLLVLATAAVLPVAVMSGAAVVALIDQQQRQSEAAARDLTRAFAASVDAELARTESMLRALATTPQLDGEPRIDAFLEGARRVSAQMNGQWLAVILATPDGRILASDSRTPGSPASPPLVEQESFRRAVEMQRSAIGYLARGPRGRWGVPVRVPVIREGELRYVLTAVLSPDAIRDVLKRQRVPADWVASVFDANNLRVARSRGHDDAVGTPGSLSLMHLMASAPQQGSGRTVSTDGEHLDSSYTRSRDTQWTVAIGRPTGAADANILRSLVIYGGGVMFSLIAGVLAALMIARSINRPITELGDAARALGAGEKPRRPRSGIREIQEVAQALIVSADQRDANEAERDALLRAERDALQHAEEANRVKDEFLAMLGHELRNPLAPIVTALEVMEQDGRGHSSRETAIIKRQVAHLSRLVDDLLDVSRITQGKIELRRERVDMKAVVARAIELAQPSAQDVRAIEVVLCDAPVFVNGDSVRLTQVLCNLLLNALKFTPPEGRVTLRLSRGNGIVECSVDDNGRGIDTGLLPHVFEPFVQGHQRLDRHAGGLGLGLAIVKTLVEMHGGSVEAYSAGAGHGSVFTLRLPALDDMPDTPSKSTPPSMVETTNSRVLVVDDNVDAAEMLCALLSSHGYDVRSACDGWSALRLLDDFVPELAILDIGLPSMDGYELARRLRADPRTRSLRLIALTGYGTQADRERAMQANFNEHLVKPVQAEKLLDVMRAAAH